MNLTKEFKIDSDLYLPVLMDRYLVQNANGSQRASEFLS